jgi:hypothetical protein
MQIFRNLEENLMNEKKLNNSQEMSFDLQEIRKQRRLIQGGS